VSYPSGPQIKSLNDDGIFAIVLVHNGNFATHPTVFFNNAEAMHCAEILSKDGVRAIVVDCDG
jgi:hypothetical protein